jgi:hypothetical protein
MAFNKAIQHGKERRRPYQGSAAVDASCRHGGSCPRCRRGRQHRNAKRLLAAKQATEEA